MYERGRKMEIYLILFSLKANDTLFPLGHEICLFYKLQYCSIV